MGEIAVFRIYDDGKGMDEESLKRTRQRIENAREISGPLFRNKGADSHNTNGTCIELRMHIKLQMGEEG